MDGDAILMLAIGATLLWGGLVLAIVNYLRRSRHDRD